MWTPAFAGVTEEVKVNVLDLSLPRKPFGSLTALSEVEGQESTPRRTQSAQALRNSVQEERT